MSSIHRLQRYANANKENKYSGNGDYGISVTSQISSQQKNATIYFRQRAFLSSFSKMARVRSWTHPPWCWKWCCEISGSRRPERPQRPPRWRFGLTQLIAGLYADHDGGYHALFSFGVSLEIKRSCHFFSLRPIVDSPFFAPFIGSLPLFLLTQYVHITHIKRSTCTGGVGTKPSCNEKLSTSDGPILGCGWRNLDDAKGKGRRKISPCRGYTRWVLDSCDSSCGKASKHYTKHACAVWGPEANECRSHFPFFVLPDSPPFCLPRFSPLIRWAFCLFGLVSFFFLTA